MLSLYKFNDTTYPEDYVKATETYIIAEKITRIGFKSLSSVEMAKIQHQIKEFHGRSKYMGWIIDFTDTLKTFWVQHEPGDIEEVYNFNKTLLRSYDFCRSKIMKIVEIE